MARADIIIEASAPAGEGGGAVDAIPVGTRCQARWMGGAYYPGTIAAVNADGTYRIQHDDGDVGLRVPRSHILLENDAGGGQGVGVPPPPPAPPGAGADVHAPAGAQGQASNFGKDKDGKEVVVGDRIRAHWLGGRTVYDGRVTGIFETGDGRYYFDIAYDDGDREERLAARFVIRNTVL